MAAPGVSGQNTRRGVANYRPRLLVLAAVSRTKHSPKHELGERFVGFEFCRGRPMSAQRAKRPQFSPPASSWRSSIRR